MAGLIHVILNEKHKDTLVATLKALSRYVATTPYVFRPLTASMSMHACMSSFYSCTCGFTSFSVLLFEASIFVTLLIPRAS